MSRTWWAAMLVTATLGACSSPPTPPKPLRPTASPTPSLDEPLAAAQALVFANRYSEADTAYRRVIAAAPGLARAHAWYALFLNYRRDFTAAQREADQAGALAADDSLVLAIQCRVDDWASRLDQAVAAGRRATALDGQDAYAHLFLSEALADSGDAAGAVAELTSARAVPAEAASTYLRAEQHREAANLAHDLGDGPGQIRELKAARAEQPGWIERSGELVDVYSAGGDQVSARAILDAAIAIAPDDLETLNRLGVAGIDDGDFAATRALSDKALALEPRDPTALLIRAEVAVALDGDLDLAERLLQTALRVDPTSRAAAAYLLAIDRDLRGNEARGRAAIAAAMAPGAVPIDPDALAAADAQTALAAVNEARRSAGLAPVRLEPHLDLAARRHAEYWLFNNASTTVEGLGIHRETPGLRGYVGVYPWTRASALGYPDQRIGEDITHRGDPTAAVGDWVNSVFHRFAIVRPDLVAIGFGSAEIGPLAIEDMEFGFAPARSAQPVMFPNNGVSAVPAIFVDNELPDPVPPGKPRTTGYPVTVTFSIADFVQLTSFSLRGPDGVLLAAYLLAPSALSENSASLLPQAPLHAATRYTASIAAVINSVTYRRTWTFITAA